MAAPPAMENVEIKIEDDILTIRSDLSKRYNLSQGTLRRERKDGKAKSKPNIIIAQVPSNCYLPGDKPGTWRKEQLSYTLYIDAPIPKDETMDLIEMLLKRKDLSHNATRILGAVQECLQGYPKRMVQLIKEPQQDGNEDATSADRQVPGL